MLDYEPFTPRRLSDAGVERTSILGQPADERQDALSHVSLARLRGRRVTDGSHRIRAFTQLTLCDRGQLGQER